MVCVQEDCDIVWDDYHLNNGHQFTNNVVEESEIKVGHQTSHNDNI
jgi:hypothetical protein